ncbi:hypothetical protein [Phaeocystidibacter luteus]|uniref:Lipoprotein n=1 Tax=Phaeocystidibacter luteus TaxID=911197 RepID=A0A6N6RDK7_9FLAO|nr:hypothetical protein [Phaeocystidibacter luteus]KAB2807367.1 hypothetical protein F8C67_12385 [Phaeocystidibacter luteus]
MNNRLSALAFLLTLIFASCNNSSQDHSTVHGISDDDSSNIPTIETTDHQQPQVEGKDVNKLDSTAVKRWVNPEAIDTTLLFFEGTTVTLSFTEVKPSEEEYFLEQRLLKPIIEKNNNSHLIAHDIERIQLNRFAEFVRRDSTGLYLLVKDNSWKRVTPNESYDEMDVNFEYYFAEHGYYSIRIQWGEGNGYMLVNDSTGVETRMYGRPYFSPSGSWILSVAYDIEAGYSPNGFQLYSNHRRELELFGAFRPHEWGPKKVNWIDDDNAILTNESFEIRNGDMQYFEFNTALAIGVEK